MCSFSNLDPDLKIHLGDERDECLAHAVTITSRKHYETKASFSDALTKFQASMKYKKELIVIPEYHEQKGKTDKIHCHGIIYSNKLPGKNNKKNAFFFVINKITDYQGWFNYCTKSLRKACDCETESSNSTTFSMEYCDDLGDIDKYPFTDSESEN